jgi:VIT1/CCC1 family predicted Fe2+/Mn2+ transporter
MTPLRLHTERHAVERIGWLRAAVLGANDGILSTVSLIVGVAAAEATRGSILIAGMAGLVAGAMSRRPGSRTRRTDRHLCRTRADARALPGRWPCN